MYIRRLEVTNFRGLTGLALDLDETTVIFGSNNTGKSTILTAIHAVLSRAFGRRSGIFSEYDFHLETGVQPTDAKPIEIKLTFGESVADEWPESKVQQLGNVVGIGADGLQTVTLRVTGKYDEALNLFVSNFDFLDPTGNAYPPNQNSVRRLQQIIPAFYLAALRDAAKEFRPGAPFWGPFVKALKIDPEVQKEIEEEIAALNQKVLNAHTGFEAVKDRLAKSSKLVPLGGGGAPVSIEALPSRIFDILAKTQVMLSGVSGAALPLGQHGEGTQSLAVICLFDAFLDARLVGEYGEGAVPILTLEEPEAHLHPAAVRAVGRMLAAFAGQKIITTHSGDLLASVSLKSLRRLSRIGGEVKAFQIDETTFDPVELKRLDHHIRRHRGGFLFARVWILVEGETDELTIQEIARILGHDLYGEGVCCFEFTLLTAAAFIKLADQLGIHWIVVADGDPQGQKYAAAAQALLNGRAAADHISQMPAYDIETLLCLNGYGHLYQATIVQQKLAAKPNPHAVGTHDYWQHVTNELQPGRGKPARMLPVLEAIELNNAAGVPQYFKDLIALALAKAKEGA